ncbi:hypothetical protein [Dethiosulfovibrio marinus]|uniref:Uncharacterized protein n=1 Tax=Dethiosulfovibrio marinus TaxID=133532 RepID=A0ABS9EU36_9BACT|nr:hypothetical protein [Dethiosulfovibrio marinus]MCF4143701.1 hypothetical protein [Dethiosulfovibrio marinus]
MGEAVSYKVIRESDEEVRYERFLSQFNIFSSSPRYYGNSLYLDVLDKTLPFRRKYLIPKDREDMMFGLSGLAPAVSLPDMAPNVTEYISEE